MATTLIQYITLFYVMSAYKKRSSPLFNVDKINLPVLEF